MNILIRCDSSINIGSGHIYRCLILAKKLKSLNHKVVFLTRNLPGNINFIIRKKYQLFTFPKPKTYKYSLNNYNKWLGVTWKEDLNQTIRFIDKFKRKIDLLIVDNYSLDYKWEQEIKKKISLLMVIEGPMHNKHNCDLLLNQNYYRNNFDFKKNFNVNCKYLIGPKYSLIPKNFVGNRKKNYFNRKKINIFVFYGSIDKNNETLKVIKALKSFNDKINKIYVLLGIRNKNIIYNKKFFGNYNNIRLIIQTDKINQILMKCDLAFGAGGINTWERMYYGMPTIVTSITKNQEISMKNLSKTNSILYLGLAKNVTIKKLTHVFKDLINNYKIIKEMSKNAYKLIDGKGGDRVLKEIISLCRK